MPLLASAGFSKSGVTTKFKMPEFDKVKLLESVPLKEKDTEVFSSASEAVIVPANNDPSTTVRELAEVNTGLLSLVSVTVIAIAWVDVLVPSVMVAIMLYTLFVSASAGASKFGVAAKARVPDELNVKSAASSPARVELKLTESPSASDPVKVATASVPSATENELLDVKTGLLSFKSMMFTETFCLVKLSAVSVAVTSNEKLDWVSKSGAVLNASNPSSLVTLKLSESDPPVIAYKIESPASASVAAIEPTAVWFSLILKLEREVKIGDSSFISFIDTVMSWLSLREPSDTLTFIEYEDFVSKSGGFLKDRFTLFSALLVKRKELESSPLMLNIRILLSASVAVMLPTEESPSLILKLEPEVMLGAVFVGVIGVIGVTGAGVESLSPSLPPARSPTRASIPNPPAIREPLLTFVKRESLNISASSCVSSPLSINSSNSFNSFKYSSIFSISSLFDSE